jgi:hypothetical protein
MNVDVKAEMKAGQEERKADEEDVNAINVVKERMEPTAKAAQKILKPLGWAAKKILWAR